MDFEYTDRATLDSSFLRSAYVGGRWLALEFLSGKILVYPFATTDRADAEFYCLRTAPSPGSYWNSNLKAADHESFYNVNFVEHNETTPEEPPRTYKIGFTWSSDPAVPAQPATWQIEAVSLDDALAKFREVESKAELFFDVNEVVKL